MDEITIKSKLMQKVVKKLIEKTINEKLGLKNGLSLTFNGPISFISDTCDCSKLDLNVTISIQNSELRELLKDFL